MSADLPTHRFQVGCGPAKHAGKAGLLERGSIEDVRRVLADLDEQRLELAFVIEYAYDVSEVDDFHSEILTNASARVWLERDVSLERG